MTAFDQVTMLLGVLLTLLLLGVLYQQVGARHQRRRFTPPVP